MNFAKVIKAHLERKGWTQQMLADNAGLSKSAVSLLMNGKSQFNLVQLDKVATALRVPLWKLVKEAKGAGE